MVGEQAILIGVVSRGYKCALRNKPGVVERVKVYLDWIDKVMKMTGGKSRDLTTQKNELSRCEMGTEKGRNLAHVIATDFGMIMLCFLLVIWNIRLT